MIDLTEIENTWASKCGQLLQEEKTKPSTMQSLLKKIQSSFSDCHVSDKYIVKCNYELNRCKTYTHVLMWLSSKFCYGSGNGVIK